MDSLNLTFVSWFDVGFDVGFDVAFGVGFDVEFDDEISVDSVKLG